MRAIFTLGGIVLVLVLVGVLVKKQLAATRAPLVPATAAQGSAVPAGSVRDQSRQAQEQMRQQVEAMMQQARPGAGEEK